MSTPTWQLLAQIDRIHEMAEHLDDDPPEPENIEVIRRRSSVMAIDLGKQDEQAAAEQPLGRCDLCGSVLLLDLVAREVYCAAGELHPGFPVRYPMPTTPPRNLSVSSPIRSANLVSTPEARSR